MVNPKKGFPVPMTTMTRPVYPIRFPRKLVLGTLLILLGVSGVSLPQYLRAKKSTQWPSVPGVITASWMRSGLCKGMPCYHGEIEYRYRVEGADRRGTRLDLSRSHWAARESWQRVLDQYPPGKAVTVYYETANPANSVLAPGLVGEMEELYRMDLGMICFFGFCLAAAFLWYRDPDPSIAELHLNPRKNL